MLDPTHKAILVLLNTNENHKIMDVGVFVGPTFGIGRWDSNGNGYRLLLTEVKTSDVDLTDRAIWHSVRKHDWVLRSDYQPYSVEAWVHNYEEHEVTKGTLTLSECLVFGKQCSP